MQAGLQVKVLGVICEGEAKGGVAGAAGLCWPCLMMGQHQQLLHGDQHFEAQWL